MEISNLNIYKVNPTGDTWLWLSIETTNGLVGWGELTESGNDEAVSQIILQASNSLIGKDPRKLIQNTSEFYQWRFPSIRGNRLYTTAWSGIDQALWDLTAQSYQMPLFWLLGGFGQNKIPLYANLNRGLRKNRTPEALQNNGKKAIDAGFSIVKCTPFDELNPFIDMPNFSLALERIKALTEITPISNVAIDCHERFNRSSLHQVVDWLEEFGFPYWLEDPLPLEYHDEITRLKSRCPRLRLAGGESTLNVSEVWDILDQRSVDVFMPDVKHIGGVSPLKAVIPLTEERGLWVSLHNPTSPIGTAFSAHLLSLARKNIPLEFPWMVVEDREQATTPTEPILDGYYHLSDRPGIGLKPNENYLKKYATKWEAGQWRPV